MRQTRDAEGRVQTPVRHDGHFGCPRCQGRLLFDGDDFVCVVCGYEHEPITALGRSGEPAKRMAFGGGA